MGANRKGKGGYVQSTAKRDRRGVRAEDYNNGKHRDNSVTSTSCEDMLSILSLVQDARENEKKTGRPSKFDTVEELEAAIAKFWKYINEKNANGVFLIPDVEGLCAFMRVGRETLNGWERTDFRGFSAVITKAKNDIAYCKKQLALRGKVPAVVFAIDVNNNHGYKQKQEIEVTPRVATTEQLSADELQKKIVGDVVIDSTAEVIATIPVPGDYEEAIKEEVLEE